MITNPMFGFKGKIQHENFFFQINVNSDMVVKSFHKGQPTGDLTPIQEGTDKTTGLPVALYCFSDNSAHTYEVTDGTDSLKFEIRKKQVIWL